MKKIYLMSMFLIIIDQFSKYLITSNIVLGTKIKINEFLDITNLKNIGAAFSILKGKTVFLVVLTIIVLILGSIYLHKKNNFSKFETITNSLIIGGIIGNLIDRIMYGYVVDFISFNINNHYFPVFNLADSFIVIGVLIYIIKIIKEEYHARI